MSIFGCDWQTKKGIECGKTPVAELFFTSTEDGGGYWCYVCRCHYIKLMIQRWLGKREFGVCRVATDREIMEHMMEEIVDIQCDLMDIREALGIKEEYPELKSFNDEEIKEMIGK